MSTGNAITMSGGGGSVDATIIDNSPNAVSGNAVFDALAALPSSTVTRTAVQALGGQRAVVAVGAASCDYADQTNAAHFGKLIGFTVGAIGAGLQVQVQTTDAIDNPGWAFTPDQDVFLGSNGLVTQTEPAAGNFQQVVGYAVTATKLWISISDPIRN